jgi:hypothetical protein
MITVIIKGTKNIDNTLRSLLANAEGRFRVYTEDSVRARLSKEYNIEFVKPGIFRKYGKKSDLYWFIKSGSLILTTAWDKRFDLCKKKTLKPYCLGPGGQKYLATNYQLNVGRWLGSNQIVPILRVTEA